MKEKSDKILTLVMLAVAIVATVFAVLFAIHNGDKDSLEGIETGGSFFDLAYIILMCLVGLSIIGIIVFLVLKLANRFMSDSKYWVKFLTITAICAAVILISYFVLSSGSDVPAEFLEKNETSKGTSKLIGAACWMVYILAAGTIVSILVTEVVKTFKKR